MRNALDPAGLLGLSYLSAYGLPTIRNHDTIHDHRLCQSSGKAVPHLITVRGETLVQTHSDERAGFDRQLGRNWPAVNASRRWRTSISLVGILVGILIRILRVRILTRILLIRIRLTGILLTGILVGIRRLRTSLRIIGIHRGTRSGLGRRSPSGGRSRIRRRSCGCGLGRRRIVRPPPTAIGWSALLLIVGGWRPRRLILREHRARSNQKTECHGANGRTHRAR